MVLIIVVFLWITSTFAGAFLEEFLHFVFPRDMVLFTDLLTNDEIEALILPHTGNSTLQATRPDTS